MDGAFRVPARREATGALGDLFPALHHRARVARATHLHGTHDRVTGAAAFDGAELGQQRLLNALPHEEAVDESSEDNQPHQSNSDRLGVEVLNQDGADCQQHQGHGNLAHRPARVDPVANKTLLRASVTSRESLIFTAVCRGALLQPSLAGALLSFLLSCFTIRRNQGLTPGRLRVLPLRGRTVLRARAVGVFLHRRGRRRLVRHGVGTAGFSLLVTSKHRTTLFHVNPSGRLARGNAGQAQPKRYRESVHQTENFDQLPLLRDRVHELMPRVVDDLKALVRIPSVSLSSFDQSEVWRSAQAVAALLEAEGMDVQIVVEGGRPGIIAHKAGPQGSPTVLLYAHHDVQPPGDEADWDTPPFEPTERDGRLYGRGAADDKAGVMAHIAALRAWGDNLPCNVTIFIEGEEEIASDSLPAILNKYADELTSDVLVLADSSNWAVGTPALTTTLRGTVRVVVTLKTLKHSVHSGMFGGAAPDAVTSLCRLLASLHDDAGSVRVAGLEGSDDTAIEYDPAQLRQDAGMLPGTEFIGEGSLTSRLWTKPSITVIGIDAPDVDVASNTLVASARAKISLRVAPTQDPKQAYEALAQHLKDNAPWGAEVQVELEETGSGFAADASGPVYAEARAAFKDAWGNDPVDVGIGGSIPFVAEFAQMMPNAALLVTGVEDPDTRAHGANESLHLGEFEHVCLAEAVLLGRMGALGRVQG